MTSIGGFAFSGCRGLTSIEVESGNTKYDSRNNCNAIIESSTNTLLYGCKNTTIPNSVTSIGNSAFYYCSGLTSVTIPNSVTYIGEYAFEDCSGLTTFTCYAADIPTADSTIFEGIDLTIATLYVPASALEDYEDTIPWKGFGTILPIDENAVPTAIDTAAADDYMAYFDLSGHRVTSSQRGLLIVRDRSGKTRKVMVK